MGECGVSERRARAARTGDRVARGALGAGRRPRRVGCGAALFFGAASAMTFGCGAARSTLPPRPPVDLPALAGGYGDSGAPGSLWRADRGANYALLDVRPRFPGDLLTIVIAERAQGTKDADTELSTSSSIAASVQEFFGIPTVGSIDPSNVVQANSARSFEGEGETTRSGSLEGRITVTVTAVEPNGNLHVEGQKVVNLNNEEEYMVLQGVVRPADIDASNEVASWRLADARIEFFGSGVVGDQQRPGFGYTILDWLWPF